ncbi:helix-turn-helix domain-containing protein [Lacticaseibacillus paracasei]|uniref:helix-turn-helix domain-containing protein n=1 Tax=Lacticaseibacillus paracasei TaxID=1597 RepID=UPI000FF83FEE|nr:helix-turn-helix transcriptional regulator [Lacticaseibacillus paracasei]RNE46144.1 helix-turn-helix protein [Lacticaseibacillus paracasei]
MTTWEDFSQKLKKDNPEKLAIIKTLADLESERIKQGISQKDFAEKIGMKQPQLAKIERLDSLPTLATLNRYAKGLGKEIRLSIVTQ